MFQCAGIMPSNAATTGLKFGPDFGVLGHESSFAHCDCESMTAIVAVDLLARRISSTMACNAGVPIAVWSYDRF
jgi:hypothetical protein